MENTERTIKAYVDPILVITIITLVVSILTLAVSVYESRYNTNVESGKSAIFNFSPSTSQSATLDIECSAGQLMYGMMQSEGNSYMVYKTQYKKASSSNYKTLKSSYSFPQNNIYYGEWDIIYNTNAKNDINFKLTKSQGTSENSTVTVDLMIE